MNRRFALVCMVLITMSCKEISKEDVVVENNKISFNQALADELSKMVEINQVAAFIPQGKYKELSEEDWNTFKDSVFSTYEKRLQEIFDTYGFAGYDLVGEKGSMNFWLMVQHCDHNPDFQNMVLKKMLNQVIMVF